MRRRFLRSGSMSPVAQPCAVDFVTSRRSARSWYVQASASRFLWMSSATVTPTRSHKPNVFARPTSGFPRHLTYYDSPVPRKGPAYPIDNEWRQRVEAAIDSMRISHAEFARQAKISKASLSEALSSSSKQSTLVPAIHKALGWPPPRPLLLSQDAEEIMHAISGMDPRDIAAVKERALTLLELRRRKS